MVDSNDIMHNSVSLFTNLVKSRLSCLKADASPRVIFANLPARYVRPDLQSALDTCNEDIKKSCY